MEVHERAEDGVLEDIEVPDKVENGVGGLEEPLGSSLVNFIVVFK